jgi:hypothetical protein
MTIYRNLNSDGGLLYCTPSFSVPTCKIVRVGQRAIGAEMYKGMQKKPEPIGRRSEKRNTKDGEGTEGPFIKWVGRGVKRLNTHSMPSVLYMIRTKLHPTPLFISPRSRVSFVF